MIRIRSAVQEDIPFISRCVMAAAGIRDMDNESDDTQSSVIRDICAMEHSLYNWNHARIAVDSQTDMPVGCLIGYDGKRYARAREMTFGYLEEHLGWKVKDTDMETCKGEYYIDSLAVIPEYRGKGIGRLLVEDAISEAREAGHNRLALIAEIEAPALQSYYYSMGFNPEEEIIFFGTRYIRMVRNSI